MSINHKGLHASSWSPRACGPVWIGPCRDSAPVKEAGTTAPFAHLFDKFSNNVICKKFEIAHFWLICWLGMIENQSNQSKVIYEPICG